MSNHAPEMSDIICIFYFIMSIYSKENTWRSET